jgi:hypothetical protein
LIFKWFLLLCGSRLPQRQTGGQALPLSWPKIAERGKLVNQIRIYED